MSFNPQEKSANAIPLPKAGIVPARCARIIEVGEHSTFYGIKNQVILFFSLPTRIIESAGEYDGKQHMVRTAPLRVSSSDKATLMEYVNILNPRATSLDLLLDQPCFLTLIHNEVESGGQARTFCNINNISGVPEGIEVGALDTNPFYFSFDDPSQDVWENELWEGMREQIKSALNYQGSKVEEMVLRIEALSS